MVVDIIAIGDTHASTYNDIPLKIRDVINNTDWVIHVGDFISENIAKELINIKGEKFKGVYGNADPLSIRKMLPHKDIFEIGGQRIGIIHPSQGGPEYHIEKIVLAEFKHDNLDLIIYGHTHDAQVTKYHSSIIVNPGKGYLDRVSFDPQASYAIITIDGATKVLLKQID